MVDEETESKKDYLTYDKESKKYTRVLFDLYRWYNKKELIGLDALLDQASCGMKKTSDFLRDDDQLDMKKLVDFSHGILQLWDTPVSPEKFMQEGNTFEKAARDYAEEAGVASAIDAHLAGVPIEDLLA